MVAFEDLTAELTAVMDKICAADSALLADGESLVALHRATERLNAARTRATAAFDAVGEWEADGAQTAAAWVATKCRLPREVARREVSRGRQLRNMPVVEASWLAGEINSAHVDRLRHARTTRTAEAFAQGEEMLCDYARTMYYQDFAKAVTYWRYQVDPDGAEDQQVVAQEAADNAALASVCSKYADCRWDGYAMYNVQFSAADVSTVDYFHPNKTGQNTLAATAWARGYWPGTP